MKRGLIGAGVFAGLWLALMLFSAAAIVPPRGLLFDLTPRYIGGRALWEGQSPYAPEVTESIQRAMFGGLAVDGMDQARFVYPAYTALILAPLLALPPQTAIAAWIALQLLAVLITPIVWLAILDWRPPPLLLAGLLLALGFVFRYPMNMYIVGQFTGTILLGLSLAFLCLKQGRDVLAGVILALTAIPPQIAAPIAGVLLLAYALVGRPRGLIAFVATLALMTLMTTLQIGWWIPDFVAQLRDYPAYAAPIWSPGMITAPFLRYGLIALVVTLLAYMIYRFVHQPKRAQALDLFAATILSALLLLPVTGNYYLVLLIPVLMISLWRATGWRFRWMIWIGAALAVISPWFYRTQTPGLEGLLLPLHIGILWLGARSVGYARNIPQAVPRLAETR